MFTQLRVVLLFFPFPAGQLEIRLAYGEIVGGPVRIYFALVHRHEIDGCLRVTARLAEPERTYLPLENDHCAVLHPCFHVLRVGTYAFGRLRLAEKEHLHGSVVLAVTAEKSLAKIALEIVFEQCGKVLGHGVFIA